jgi:DNA-binding NtrC family response regulator
VVPQPQPVEPPAPQIASSVASSVPVLEQVTQAKEKAEADAILQVLQATHWNRKQAAAALHIDYKALLYKMKKLSIMGMASGSDSRLT